MKKKGAHRDLAKLESFAEKIEELGYEFPKNLKSRAAQDAAGQAEVALMRLASEMKAAVSEWPERVRA